MGSADRGAGPPIGIAGAGPVAQALGRLLVDRGQPVVAVASRSPKHAAAAALFMGGHVEAVSWAVLRAEARRLLIAVSDSALGDVARVLGAGFRRGVALHTCGTRGPDALAPLAATGVSCGTFHPLQTIATPEQGVRALQGIAFGVTADGPAADWAEELAAVFEGEILWIPAADRPLYHTAAVLASNGIVGLLDAAVCLMTKAGVAQTEARRALAPLAQTSVRNASAMGPQALTGPAVRGDVDTVAGHIRALAGGPPGVAELYRAVSLYLVDIAKERGLREEQVRALRDALAAPGSPQGSPCR